MTPTQAVTTKTSAGFVIPFAAWVGLHMKEISALCQLVLVIVGIVGGLPAAWKGLKFVAGAFRARKQKTRNNHRDRDRDDGWGGFGGIGTNLLFAGCILFLACGSGCTYRARSLAVAAGKSDERAREVVSAAQLANRAGRDALSTSNTPRAMLAYDLSAQFLGRGQALLGLPLEDQTARVAALLSENESLRQEATEAEQKRLEQEQVWRTQKAAYEAKLLEYGTKYEAERNRSVVRRFWGWLVSTLGIGGIIALCVFCPAAIPLIMRLVGWAASKIPSLASAVGVVSKKAFDQVVVGVESAKKSFRENGNPAAAEILDTELSCSMDQDHKNLVRGRKDALRATLKAM
jgi:hypothetical protein